ncbi:MAG: hypothetical protein AAF416_22485 [Pseudomonadota bacterium]
MYILVYILLCIVVGWLGRRKAIGFVGFFLLSVVITPILTLVALMVTADRDRDEHIRPKGSHGARG